MPITEITSKTDFLEKILGSEDAIIIECYADWCAHCKAIAPKFEELSNVYPQITFYKVDIDKVDDVAQELGPRGKPTFMLFKDGSKITEVVGAVPSALEQGIKTHLL
ncbi:unnamed protein product [Penicillium glandicola]